MPAVVRFDSVLATINGYEWECDDSVLKALLDSMLDPDGPSPSNPQPDITEARRVAEVLGGEVMEEIPEEHEEGKVY